MILRVREQEGGRDMADMGRTFRVPILLKRKRHPSLVMKDLARIFHTGGIQLVGGFQRQKAAVSSLNLYLTI